MGGGGPLLPSGYEHVRELGRGAFAVVHLAYDTERASLRALKLLVRDPRLTFEGAAVDRMVREASLYRRLTHPHILTLHDVGVFGGMPYLVTDYAEGGSVAAHVQVRGKLPAPTVARLGACVASALAAAHDADVVHRDVKPGNILLSSRGVLLGDFGIASQQARHTLTRTGASMGTLGYVPPEQLQDARQVTPTADLYALGATLFHLATGRSPRDLYLRSYEAFTRLGVPDLLTDVIYRCTRRRPDHRPSTARDVAAQLVAVGRALPPERPHLGHLLDGKPPVDLPDNELPTQIQRLPPGLLDDDSLREPAERRSRASRPPVPRGLGPTVTPRLARPSPAAAPEREAPTDPGADRAGSDPGSPRRR